MFEYFSLLNKDLYNSFLFRLKTLEDNFFENPNSKTDLLSLEETMALLPQVTENLGRLSDQLNKHSADLLRENLIDKYSLEHLDFKVRPFTGKQIELDFEREREIITPIINEALFNESKNAISSFVNEAKTLTPNFENEISLELKDLKSILNKSANGIKIDIKDTQGRKAEIDAILQEGKNIVGKHTSETQEFGDIIPFTESTLEDLTIKIKSSLPVKVASLDLVNIDYSKIARSNVFETEISDLPFKGFKVIGFDKGIEDFRLDLFQVNINVWIGESKYEITNADTVIFGSGISSREIKYLNINRPVYQFKVEAIATLKQKASKDIITDFSKMKKKEIVVTADALKEGVPLSNAFGEIEVIKKYDLSSQSQSSFAETSFELPLEYREFGYFSYMKLIDSENNILSLSSSPTQTTFSINGGILSTLNTKPKRIFYDNTIRADFDGERIVLESELPIIDLELRNSLVNRNLRKEYDSKVFRKYDLDVITLPLELSIESISTFSNNTRVDLEEETSDTELPSQGKYLVKDENILVYLKEEEQRFGKVFVYGQEIKYQPLEIEEVRDKFYVKGSFKEESAYLQNESILASNIIPSSIKVDGYTNFETSPGRWIENISLPVQRDVISIFPTVLSPEAYITIPFVPFLYLEVPIVNYRVEDNKVIFDANDYTEDYLTTSFYLSTAEKSKVFKITKDMITFDPAPAQPIEAKYLVFQGLKKFNFKKPIPFSYENGVVKVIGESGSLTIRYLEGRGDDIEIFHPQKLYLETFNLNE